VILRPVAVIGEGARGNIAALLRLAALPLPLPLGGLGAPRSLLAIDSLAGAVHHILEAPTAGGGTFTVCDRPALSIAEIVAAMRAGAGRRPTLFSLPGPLLPAMFTGIGRRAAWDRLSGPLTAEAGGLEATGWQAATDMPQRLASLASRR
jgi:UDP-glucose 4-epimerase